MWEALFTLLGKGFDFASKLVGGSKPPAPVADTENPAAARAGAAAGAAANHASHIAGPPKVS